MFQTFLHNIPYVPIGTDEKNVIALSGDRTLEQRLEITRLFNMNNKKVIYVNLIYILTLSERIYIFIKSGIYTLITNTIIIYRCIWVYRGIGGCIVIYRFICILYYIYLFYFLFLITMYEPIYARDRVPIWIQFKL